MAGVQGTSSKSVSYAATQTNAVLVAAPGAGKRIVVRWAVLANGATAGEHRLIDGPVISAAITANSQANPTVVTCGVYVPTGSTVTITGSNSTPLIDGTYVATNVNATTFSIPVNVTLAGSAGTVTATGTLMTSALLAINTPAYINAKRSPFVLTAATPLVYTSVTSSTSRVNIGYSIETG